MDDILVLLIFWIASALAVKSPVTQIGLMPTCAVSIYLLFVVKIIPLTGFAEKQACITSAFSTCDCKLADFSCKLEFLIQLFICIYTYLFNNHIIEQRLKAIGINFTFRFLFLPPSNTVLGRVHRKHLCTTCQ